MSSSNDASKKLAVVIKGTGNPDRLVGNRLDNIILGYGANDKLSGLAGDDELVGGAGSDKLFGGAGRDLASYYTSKSGLTVSLTDTSLNTGDAKGDSYTSIEGIAGSVYSDTLYGNTGGNLITADSGNDTIYGLGGPDLLFGEGGDDTLYGGDQGDLLNGGAGADRLFGGSGRDVASYTEAKSGVNIFLSDASRNTGEGAGDTFSSIEGIVGSRLSDKLYGNSKANTLDGQGGNDVLNAGLGNDILKGDGGRDKLIGGKGSDTLIGGAGADKLNGGTGVDKASYSDASAGVLVDMAHLSRNTGDAKGDVFISIESLVGSDFADRLIGNNKANEILGGDGNDAIKGGGGADKLAGMFGNNTIWGGAGNDQMSGNAGNDKLTGGSGDDAFIFATPLTKENIDTVTDFTVGDDFIELNGYFYRSLEKGEVSADEFVIGSKAVTEDQHLIYNSKTGALSYDADGAGGEAAVKFAQLSKGLALSADDFLVF